MHQTSLDKSRLAAFADGELSPEDAAVIVMHLAEHPADQAFVDNLMAANEALARAFAAPMTEPVPAAILAAIEGRPARAKIITLFRHRVVAFGGGAALAASIVLAAVLLPAHSGPGLTVGPVAKGHALHSYLQTLPLGRTVPLGSGQELTILATLPTPSGHCREVELVDRPANRLDVALACTAGAGWQVEVALSEPLPDSIPEPGYVPAGGVETVALTAWLDRVGAGMALDAAGEAEAMARGWSR